MKNRLCGDSPHSENIDTEMAALEQALAYIERASEALEARDELHRQRLGHYSGARLGRGDLGLTALKIKNELERLRKPGR